MGSWLSSEVLIGILRSLLTTAGSGLVADGVLTGGQLQQGVGAIVLIAGIVTSVISNRSKAKANAVVKAVEAHPNITVVPASQSYTGKPIVRVAPEPTITTQLGH